MSGPIKQVDIFRNLRRAEAKIGGSSSETVKELREIKGEIQVTNDLKAAEINSQQILTASPYLNDQSYYNKETIYNSDKETDWKNVRSHEENLREALVYKTLKRLNII